MMVTVKAGYQNERVHSFMEISNLFQMKISSAVVHIKYDKEILKSYYKKFPSCFWMHFRLAYEFRKMYINTETELWFSLCNWISDIIEWFLRCYSRQQNMYFKVRLILPRFCTKSFGNVYYCNFYYTLVCYSILKGYWKLKAMIRQISPLTLIKLPACYYELLNTKN